MAHNSTTRGKIQLGKLVAIVICLYLIVTTIKAIADLWRAGDKHTNRQMRVETLKKEQEELLKKKAAASRPGFLEKVAYDQLGMSRPGEEIIIIPQELLVDRTPVIAVDNTPNWQKWVRLLF